MDWASYIIQSEYFTINLLVPLNQLNMMELGKLIRSNKNSFFFQLNFISKVVRTGPVSEPVSLSVQSSMVGPKSDRSWSVFN
jgi:hypothetical protein